MSKTKDLKYFISELEKSDKSLIVSFSQRTTLEEGLTSIVENSSIQRNLAVQKSSLSLPDSKFLQELRPPIYKQPQRSAHTQFTRPQYHTRPQIQHKQATKAKYHARFVAHKTCNDNDGINTFTPGTEFRKVWQFRNDGDRSWPKTVKVVFISKQTGDPLGDGTDLIWTFDEEVQKGKEKDISVYLRAPNLPGQYEGFWKLADESGRKFGQRVRVKIMVQPEPSMDSANDGERKLIADLTDWNAKDEMKLHCIRAIKSKKDEEITLDDVVNRLILLGIKQIAPDKEFSPILKGNNEPFFANQKEEKQKDTDNSESNPHTFFVRNSLQSNRQDGPGDSNSSNPNIWPF